ncbi:MAG: flagella synthesis protein FlgN [Halioglobus sp.]
MILELKLLSLLDNETTSMQKLLDILKREHDALLSADIESLEQVTAEKNAAIASQSQATQERQNATTAASYSGTDLGLEQLIDTCENREQLKEYFSNLMILARACQTENRNNGRLIIQKQRRAKGALDVIRQNENTTPTYSVQGKASDTLETRSLGKA